MATLTEDEAVRLETRYLAELGFQMETARLWVGDADHMEQVSEHPDIYSLLDEPFTQAVASTADFIALVTTGWAAPVGPDGEPDGPPSLSEGRRRVRLCVFASRESVVSVLRFADDPFTPVTVPGTAFGSFADAIQSLFA